MNWIHTFIMVNLIGICSNLDNIGAGFAYGLKNIRLPFLVNLTVNIIGFLMTLFGSFLGFMISRFISAQEAAWTSCCLLCSMGVWILYKEFMRCVCCKKPATQVQVPGIRQGILLGIALSFTNIVNGFGVTIAQNSTILPISISMAVWGYLAIWFGNKLGNGTISKLFKNYSSLVGGLLFVILGIHQIF